MNTKSKKEQHKVDLRQVIIEAAKKLFSEDGYQATSIRRIAKAIGYSPTTIYLYFKDKNDIFYALHQAGFIMLRKRFLPLAVVEDPFERLKALGKNYIDFAVQNPEYYAVMFLMSEPFQYLENHCVDQDWPEGERVFEFLEGTIQECQGKGYFKDQAYEMVALQAWSSVHGLATLAITKHLLKIVDIKEMPVVPEQLLDAIFDVYVSFLEGKK